MRYGVYDTKDKCWLGDESGPKLFEDDLMMAKVAAQVYEDQLLGTDLGCRFVAKPFDEKDLRKKDDVLAVRSTLESIKRIEGER